MDKRTEEILFAVIREHIKSAQPVGSEVIVEKYRLGVSSATVRNVLLRLEREGYLAQPHTSAGRIPTAKAYAAWVGQLKIRKLQAKEITELEAASSQLDETGFRQLAKEIARLSNGAVYWAFHRRNYYYTGISNLLTQPEFVHSNLIYDISAVVDRIEDVIEQNFDRFSFGTEILIAETNPFSKLCSTVVMKYRYGGNIGVMGVLAPLRQDYEHNVALIKYIESKLK